MSVYVHLHAHSNYSADGLAAVSDIVNHVKGLGQTAVALTEHGHVSSWPELDRCCRKAGIKPIFGIEANIAYNNRIHHLTLLCMDNTGIENVYALVRRQQPPKGKLKANWVTLEDVLELSGGIICLSGCLASIVARLPTYEEKLEHIQLLQQHFGDRLYLEVQPHTFDEQVQHNAIIRQLATATGIPITLTHDAHYLTEEEVEVYFSSKSWGAEVGNRADYKMYYGAGDNSPEALMSVEVANRCTATLPKWVKTGHLHLDDTEASTTIALYREKAKEEYAARLDMELKVIHEFECWHYFILLHDIIKYGQSQGIIFGPGRGSAAGSLVAYVLGITDVDPIKYGLYFERFLNPGRKALPDIDVDIQGDKREAFLSLLAERYGRNNVAQVCTYLQNQAGSAILAAARCLGIDHHEAYKYSKIIPNDAGKKWSLDKCFEEIPEFANIPEEWATLARKLEGTIKGFGVHAAAIIVAEDIINTMPCNSLPSATLPVVMYDMADLEGMGLIKFDLLGLKTLTMLSKIQERVGQSYKANLADGNTYSLISSGNTFGVFQMESSGCQEVQKAIKPDSIDDISAILALYRPGPLSNGYDKEYAHNKHNGYKKDNITSLLSDTYGIMIYQEQTMRLATELCRYTPAEADNLRKAIGKKLPEEMERHKIRMMRFGRGALYEKIKGCAAYQFNKSHSVAYAHITYYNAYAKTHHIHEWAAAYLETYEDLGIVHQHPQLFAPPCLQGINKCHISVADDGTKRVHLPMTCIPSLGPTTIAVLLEHAPYHNLEDMFARVPKAKFNVRHREAVVAALNNSSTLAPILGVVLGTDPIISKRKYYTNKGLGNTKNVKFKVPGYLVDISKFVAKKSGRVWCKGVLVDELGKLEFMADESFYEAALPFVKTSAIVTLDTNMTNGTCWVRGITI